jgi:hypothetical protein
LVVAGRLVADADTRGVFAVAAAAAFNNEAFLRLLIGLTAAAEDQLFEILRVASDTAPQSSIIIEQLMDSTHPLVFPLFGPPWKEETVAQTMMLVSRRWTSLGWRQVQSGPNTKEAEPL